MSHTAFPSLPATVPVFWNVSTHFFYPVHTQSLPRPHDATSVDEIWTLTKRCVHHLGRMVPGRYLLSYHTVENEENIWFGCEVGGWKVFRCFKLHTVYPYMNGIFIVLCILLRLYHRSCQMYVIFFPSKFRITWPAIIVSVMKPW